MNMLCLFSGILHQLGIMLKDVVSEGYFSAFPLLPQEPIVFVKE